MTQYTPTAIARHCDLHVRGLRCRLHEWGDAAAPLVVLLHGWADGGMSFQFLADCLHRDWRLLAPDWRGFGDSAHAPGGYWFPDYLADLDFILDEYADGAPVRLAGHSMGGNVAWLYAGVRPERVGHAASLDAFGLADTDPGKAPDRYRAWLDEWRATPAFSRYLSLDALAERVRALAPQIGAAEAAFIAAEWSRALPGGEREMKHDPRHKRVNPVPYRRQEALACWHRITAHTLLVLGRHSRSYARYFDGGGRDECRAYIPALEETVLDCGHILHLERPAELASILDAFFRRAAGPG